MDVAAIAKREGFVATKRNTDYSLERILLKGVFCCYKSGRSRIGVGSTNKTDCPFKVNFRLQPATGTYAFTSNHNLVHNHDLDHASTTMSAVARRFAPEQLHLINDMDSSGSSVTQIASELRERTNAVVLRRDIYNALGRSGRTHYDGLSQVQVLISALEGNEDVVFRVGGDERNQLSWLTFASRRAIDRFLSMDFVLLMDSTYRTNRFNMPLLLISSIDPFGQSYIVACCLLRDETAMSYNIALSSLKQLFEPRESNVETIMTDQDQSLITAIDAQFPNALHQLCRWHLEMNVKKNFASKPELCSKFTKFMRCEDELIAEQMYADMTNNASSEEAAYLERLYRLRHKYVEVWVSGHRNLGARSTQRAESMNNRFKQHLETNGPLVDLFHALHKMTKSYEETVAFMEFQLRDRPRMYMSMISSMAGRVPRFILDLMEQECMKLRWVKIRDSDEEYIYFMDSHKVSGSACTCPFFSQYYAPCVHALACFGKDALDMFHPGWIVGGASVTQPAILHGPREAPPQIAIEDRRRAELTVLAADIHTRLLDMESGAGISFARKFQEMLDRESLNEPAAIQDPPVSRSRGRPRGSRKNLFRGGRNVA